jgi:hypothetical protein
MEVGWMTSKTTIRTKEGTTNETSPTD